MFGSSIHPSICLSGFLRPTLCTISMVQDTLRVRGRGNASLHTGPPSGTRLVVSLAVQAKVFVFVCNLLFFRQVVD